MIYMYVCVEYTIASFQGSSRGESRVANSVYQALLSSEPGPEAKYIMGGAVHE